MKTHKHKKSNSKPRKTRKHGGSPENGEMEITRNKYKLLSNKSIVRIERPFGIGTRKKIGIGKKRYYVPIPKLRKLGDGAFGAVFKGSINGEYKNDGVTKVYFKKNYNSNNSSNAPRAYTKEINPPEILRTFISQKFDSKPYKQQILKRNFLKRIDNSSIFKKLNKTPNNEPLYMVKMPNLGEAILPTSGYYSKLNHIKMNKLAIQILKLLLVIYEINIKGYIHGDVRPENVMIDHYGNITLIDFDHFSTLPAFNPHLLRAFHMPLECQILTYARDNNTDDFANEYMEHVDNTKQILYDTITSNYNEDTYYEWMQQRSDKGDNVINHAKNFYNAIINAKYNDSDFNIGYNLIKNNIDLYGVGICICGILLGIDDPRREDYIRGVKIDEYVLKYIEKKLLPNIMDGLEERRRTEPFKRWTIREAIDNYSECLLTNLSQSTNLSQRQEDIKDIKDLLKILAQIDKSTSEQPLHQIEQQISQPRGRQETSQKWQDNRLPRQEESDKESDEEALPPPSDDESDEEAPGQSQWPKEAPGLSQLERQRILNKIKRKEERIEYLKKFEGYTNHSTYIVIAKKQIKNLKDKLNPPPEQRQIRSQSNMTPTEIEYLRARKELREQIKNINQNINQGKGRVSKIEYNNMKSRLNILEQNTKYLNDIFRRQQKR